MVATAKGRGWEAFGAWALAGGLLTFSVLDGFAYGIFVLPLAVGLMVLVALRARFWPEGQGLAAGVGLLCMVVAFVNRGYVSCPSGPVTLRPGQQSFSCGGFSPVPWLVAGLVLIGGAIVVYALTRRQRVAHPAP